MSHILSSLRFRITVLILLAILPAIVLFHYSNQEYRNREIALAKKMALDLIRTITEQEKSLIDGTRQLLIAVSQLDGIRDPTSEDCVQILSNLLPHYRRYLNFGVADVKGKVLCSAIPLSKSINIADRKYFSQAIDIQDFSVGEYQIGRATYRPSINFGYPIFTDDRHIIGVLFAALDLASLTQFEAEILSRLPKGSMLTKTDHDGIVLARVPDTENLVGSPAPEASAAKEILRSEEGVTTAIGPDGRRWVYAFSTYPSSLYQADLHIIYGLPENVLLADVNQVFNRNLVIMTVIGIVLLIGIWLGFEFSFLRQLRSLHHATHRLAQGDFGTRSQIFPHGNSELNDLASDFNKMAVNLQRRKHDLIKSFKKLQKSLESTANSLASAVEIRDPYTSGHQKRVTKLACAIATDMGLTNDQVEGIRITGLLHDIGKISVPAEILSKPGRLTDIEFNLIKNHPQTGYEILKNIEFPWPVAQIVLQHHERMDGSGYPQGLKGKETMLAAKILAVADVMEAMASHRPYRPALGIEAALEEIAKNKGILYDPKVVDVCVKLFIKKGFNFE